MKILKAKRGFTLIELLVVIAIIGLLASIILASLSNARSAGTLAAGEVQDENFSHALGDSELLQLDFDDCSGTTAIDQSGTSNTGTLVASPTWTTATYNGRGCALTFSGSSQYVTTPNAISVSSQNFADSIWIKTTSSADAKLISLPSYQLIQIYNGNLRVCLTSGCFVGTSVINDNKWHFAAVSASSSGDEIYLDGKPELAFSSALVTLTGSFVIGKDAGSSAYYYNGSLDEAHVYSHNLTSDEVQQLYLAEKPQHDQTEQNLALSR